MGENEGSVKKINILLCGVGIACILTGCGKTMPELTEEENQIITEYAVGLLLKYDKSHNSRLVDTSAYDLTEDAEEPEQTEELPEEEQLASDTAESTEVIDVSQDEETLPASIETYYDIPDVAFQYTGYELTSSYPSETEGEDLFFAMNATEGAELLVLKFMAVNTSGNDTQLDMLDRGARFRVSVNGEKSTGVLTTMLLNDMQTYDAVLPAGSSVELISIVEVPQGTNIESLALILRGNDESVTMTLE
ncbi:MAG: hypothetical protein J6A08_03470 [Lachnospiraceae bacterium]|nr:hypothetical protein [Lachnospiraceae bacterium]